MAKKVIQYRYYNDNNENNNPTGSKIKDFVSGDFLGNNIPILQMGIQTLPGTKFYIDDVNKERDIIIGNTGIYEINLNNKTAIGKISFDLESMEIIKNNPGAYLIIDTVYESEDE